MPRGVHKKQARTYRPDTPELYARAQAAVAEVDSDMNAHINAFLRWLAHETDELPPRPPEPGQSASSPQNTQSPPSRPNAS